MNNTLKGMTMAGLAAVFWGSMGVAGQYLLQNCHFTPMDLISIRMLLAGSIFVGIEFFLLKRGALKVFETKPVNLLVLLGVGIGLWVGCNRLGGAGLIGR